MLYKWVKYVVHAALALIVAGAVTTWITSEKYSLTLSAGETDTTLPFGVSLKSFGVVCYSGTSTPAGYECTLDLGGEEAKLSMNHVALKDGYRFFLSGYDEYGDGVVITVSHDPWGTGIVYTGYVLLLIGLIGLFGVKNSHFRRAVAAVAKTAPVAALLLFSGLQASAAEPKYLPRAQADEMGRLCVYYNGRIAPMQTMARDYVMKAYGKPGYKGLTAEQVFTGWMLFYDSWKDVPVKAKGRTEREMAVLSVASGKAVKMFPIAAPDGSVEWYSSGDRLPVYVSDEEWNFVRKVGMLIGEYAFERDYQAISGVTSKIARYQAQRLGEYMPAPAAVRAERLYNAVGRPFVPALVMVMAGLLLFVLAMFGVRLPSVVGRLVGALGLAYLTLVMALRWYVSGHVPLSTGFELMMAIAWAACLLVVASGPRLAAFRHMGVLLAGFAMMVASMGVSNPAIGALQPVLASPLLSVHVSCMMMAYTLFGLLALCGLAGLLSRDPSFALKGRVLLYPALFLMIAGTIIGSFWANVSWGNYWNWDPKETWALITIIVYALPFHSRYLGFLAKPRWFNLFSLVAFASVLFTYFGVNLLLGGMHSYAAG